MLLAWSMKPSSVAGRLFFTLLVSASAFAAEPSTQWRLRTQVDHPAGVYFDAESGDLFVSNSAGISTQKDGEGWILRGKPNGKFAPWVQGLNAPKGMRAFQGILYVADIDEVLGIEIATGIVLSRTLIPNAKYLNDVAVADDGTVYVSDSQALKIYQIQSGNVQIFAQGRVTDRPNGLLALRDRLIVAGEGLDGKSGSLYSLDRESGRKALITRKPLGALDGLEIDRDGNFLVSDWKSGKIFRVTRSGKVSDAATGLQSPGDFAWIDSKDQLVVPEVTLDRVSSLAVG